MSYVQPSTASTTSTAGIQPVAHVGERMKAELSGCLAFCFQWNIHIILLLINFGEWQLLDSSLCMLMYGWLHFITHSPACEQAALTGAGWMP